MKGFLILLLLLVLIVPTAWLALRRSNADLLRRKEFLQQSVDTLERRLLAAREPLDRLHASKKATLRLDKEFERLAERIRKLHTSLDTVLKGIDAPDNRTRQAVAENLARKREETDLLLLDLSVFTQRLDVIDSFWADVIPLNGRIRDLSARIEKERKRLEDSGALTEDLRRRVDEITAGWKGAVRLSQQALSAIWDNLDQGRVLAGAAVNKMKESIPVLEALLQDLKSQ